MEGYFNRIKAAFKITDPFLALKSNYEVEQALKTRSAPESLRILNGCYNSSTQEIIPAPFRVAAIAPVNIPIVWLMLTVSPTRQLATFGLHFINQSYNAGCNYYNRSGSEMSIEDIFYSYSLATASACSIAFVLGKIAKGGGVMIPVLASVAAGSSNIFCMRKNDVLTGVTVYNEKNEDIGISKIAGLTAVAMTALSRCALVPFTVLVVPNAIMKTFSKVIPKRFSMFAEIAIVYGTLHFALPGTLAIFPNEIEFTPSYLETEYHHHQGKLHASKGL